ncbi:MAG: GNAT family N-acetyltransferase [Clostridiales bacterium]|nr:GNAT family N-acetyltransferase [Clostridiales bacterium]
MIRPIEIKDLEFLVTVDIKDEGIKNDEIKDYDEHVKKMTHFIEHPDFGGFIYELNRQQIGCILFNIENKFKTYDWPTIYNDINDSYFDDSGQMLVVYQLWISKEHRRHGIATLLKEAIETEALNRHIYTLYTHTEIQNQHVIELNQKLSYDVVRIGPIWDDILRVSLVKDLRKQSSMYLLQHADTHNCLISADDLKMRLETDSLQLIDIRRHDDFQEKKIEGAISCYWHDVYKMIDNKTLHKKTDIIVICYTGQSSMHVATLLKTMGFNAFSLLDGMAKWPFDFE